MDGVTRRLARPFMVIATQNPVDTEVEGTHPLPKRSGTGSWRASPWGTPTARGILAMIDAHAAHSSTSSPR